MDKQDISFLLEPIDLSKLSLWEDGNKELDINPSKRQLSITGYHVENNDNTVKELLFSYKECTPTKTENKKIYDGSPMEVEYFETTEVTNSLNMNNSFTMKPETEEYKKRKNLTNEKHKVTESVSLGRKIIIVMAIILSLLLPLMFNEQGILDNCDCEVNVEQLHKDLLEEVYNQTKCIDSIVSTLHNRSQWEKKKNVLIYIGTAGVGKTFIVNIAKKHFPKQGIFEVVHINKKTNSFHSSACCKLVIIDNLLAANVRDVINFINSIPDTAYTLVIVIFNVQKIDNNLNYYFDQSAVREIQAEFTTSLLYFESCIFNVLDKTTAYTWLETEFMRRQVNKLIQKSVRDYVLTNSNLTRDGFKRLTQKLAIAIEIYTTDLKK